MINKTLINSGFSPTPFAGFLSLVSSNNANFTAYEDEHGVTLTAYVNGLTLATYIDKISETADLAIYRERLEPLTNAPIPAEEIRFYTHDFSDKRTWTSDTTGEMASWVADAETYDDVQYRWLDTSGTVVAYLDQSTFPAVWKNSEDEIIVQYVSDINVPLATKLTMNNGMIITHTDYSEAPVPGTYDLVVTSGTTPGTYKITWGDDQEDDLVWVPNSLYILNGGEQGKVHLRMSTTPPATMPSTDQVQVQSLPHPRAGDWERTDNNQVVTTSRWRMLPYDGHKIEIAEAWLSCDAGVLFQAPVHYEFYTDVPQYALTNYKAKDWKYKDINTFRAGSNTAPFVEPVTLDGHFGPIITFGYDYSKTMPQVIDSRLNQYIDIFIENNTPVSNTNGTRSTFIGRKVRSI